MPSFSKSVLSYVDVHRVFEKAGELGEVRLEFPDHRSATTWVSRANAYRVLLRKNNVALGKASVSDFDHLMVRRKPMDNVVIVEPRGFDFAKITGPDGQPIDISKQTLEGPSKLPHVQAEEEKTIEDFLADYEGQKNK